MRDTKAQKAIRERVNARLDDLEAQIQGLIRYCPPSKLSTGSNLLDRAALKVKGARLKPGEVAAWASSAEVDPATK